MCSKVGVEHTDCILIAELLCSERLRTALRIRSALKSASDFRTWRHSAIIRSVTEKIEQLVASLSGDVLGTLVTHDGAAAEVAVTVEAGRKLELAGNVT